VGGWIVSRLGGNPAGFLDLDLARDEDVGRWLVAARLLAGVDEQRALGAFRALAGLGLEAPAALARASAEEIERALAAANYPRPERTAAVLVRAGSALCDRYGGSPAALASGAEGLEPLAAGVSSLAPGIGAATVARFLRPLRDLWPDVRELPLSPAARAAAVHLGLIGAGEDEEGEPGALRAALAREPDAPSLADVEAALERLGQRACLRERSQRCPLGDDCPLRRGSESR
jgi:hypothetical protein